MKRITEMNEEELFNTLKKVLDKKTFEEIYGDWTPEKDKIKQLNLFIDSEDK